MTQIADFHFAAYGLPKPSLDMVFIPRCPGCHAPNPGALDHCWRCGDPAPARTSHSAEDVALADGLVPWTARALLRMAMWLRALAAKLEQQ